MNRITVVGTPGAGKTTLAQQIALQQGIPFVELDALFWGPRWTPALPEVFRNAVTEALSSSQWSVGGNYSSARDIIWKRSDTLIWLDYSLPFIMLRLLQRTLSRIITKEELWAGNQETWRAQFFSHDSLLLFALRTHLQRRKQFMHDVTAPDYRHLTLFRFQHPIEASAWLMQSAKKHKRVDTR